MSGELVVMIQSGTGGEAQASARAKVDAARAEQGAPAARTAPTRDQIREQIRQSIQDATRAAAEASGDESHVTFIDGRPVVVDGQNVPGIQVHRGPMDDMIPPQVVDISIAFFIMLAVVIIGWPLARAMGRRLERRTETSTLPDAAIVGQLQRIEQAVEAMSIEIERISESQRFMAKIQSGAATERPALEVGERR